MNKLVLSLFVFAFSSLLISCGGDDNSETNDNTEETTVDFPTDNVVRIHELSNIDKLNPITSATQTARNIQNYIFQAPCDFHPETFELRPTLAVSKPEVKKLESGEYAGGMSISIELRPEAKWDNGTPITASDYIFTIKTIKNPKVSAGPLRPYMEFIDHIEVDPNNPKKFTIYSKDLYVLSEGVAATTRIIPEYHYDPQGFMRNFTIKELNDPNNLNRLNEDSKINSFAEEFNNKYNHEPDQIVGSGAYKLNELKTSQHIILERKENWWGDEVDVPYLKANPKKIIHKIISDQNSALLSLKSSELDVMTGVPPEDFEDLQSDPEMGKKFELTTPNRFTYLYLGFNCKDPKFDVKTRYAISHTIDRDRIIDLFYNNLGQKINSPISPLKDHYHQGLEGRDFDLEKAKALLNEAGWADSDGDGVLDKMIQGKKEQLTVAYKYPQSSETAKNVGLLFKEEGERVGIKVELVSREWTVMLEELKKRDFEMFYSGWSASPLPDDLKQIWHTSADTYDGSNKVGFGNEETDNIIDEIRVTLDDQKRNELYMKIQEKIHEAQPYVFLFTPKNCIAISKRFENNESASLRPGYFPMLFKLKESVAKQANNKQEETAQ